LETIGYRWHYAQIRLSAIEADPVVLFDVTGNHRPVNMSEHVDFIQYYDPKIEALSPLTPIKDRADTLMH
jgi:hypothetical protein